MPHSDNHGQSPPVKYGSFDESAYAASLSSSIEHQDLKTFESLLKIEFNLNEEKFFSFMPLHHAVDMEADTAHQLGENPTPLFSKALLQAGADPYLKDKNGDSAADIATQYEYEAFLDLLPNNFNRNK